MLVVGAGAAGLLAAAAAAGKGVPTLVCESRHRPGRKLALTGGGRCNFTNTLPPREFVRRFGDRQATRLGRALQVFGSEHIIRMLAARGVEYRVEKEIRLYTRSGRAEDVVEALVAEAEEAGAELLRERAVTGLSREEGRFMATTGRGRDILAERVILCTGGLSYPGTGSTGDGHRWARELGHRVTDLRPGLVGLKVAQEWPRSLQGLVCQDAELTLTEAGGRERGRERGELLFAHFGISGPPVLDLSNLFVARGGSDMRLVVDFLPHLGVEELAARVDEDCRRHSRRSLAGALERLLPNRLLAALLAAADLDGGMPCAQLPRQVRRSLPAALKRVHLEPTGTRGIKHGEVTIGGVDWAGVDPATMESRQVGGLYFAGEILDLAGRCGGFNLQAAFATGWLAGASAAGSLL